MAKRKPNQRTVARPKRESNTDVTREYVHSLRGKFRGEGLLKALAAEKKNEKSA